MVAITLKNINKTYPGGIQAIDDLNLQIDEGDFMSIVGPSGCGKSTLLRLIAGLEDPNSGSIEFDGMDVGSVVVQDRHVAMLFQDPVLFNHMTVQKNIEFPLHCRKVPKAEIATRIDHTALMLGISELLNRKPQSLSGGQKQRVAMAAAIVQQPKVFLLDEPLSHLDPRLQKTLQYEIKRLHKELKTTFIYVTHDQNEAMSMGNKICIFNKGTLQQVGTPLDVYTKPENRFVAEFLHSYHLNFFEGQVQIDNNTVSFHCEGVKFYLPSRMLAKLMHYHGKTVQMSVRPEHMTFESLNGKNSNYVSLQIIDTQWQGDKARLTLKSRSGEYKTMYTDPNNMFFLEDFQRVYVNPEQIHFYENQPFGRNVTL